VPREGSINGRTELTNPPQSPGPYTQQKKGLSYTYDKRVVLADGVSTLPLPI
jgi:hypothetical protein